MNVAAVALRELHRIHTQLSDLEERLDRGPKQIKAREANLSRLEGEATQLHADTKSARVAADQKQLLLRSSEAKIEDLRRKLNSCTSNREYQTLLEQIAADEMAGSVLQDEILELLEKIDGLHAAEDEHKQKIAKAKEELARARKTVQDDQGLLQVDVDRLRVELKRAEEALPAEFVDAYRRMVKSKGADAMAKVEGDNCGGCFQQLTPNVLNALHMGRAVFCQSCGRLIYLPEDRSPRR